MARSGRGVGGMGSRPGRDSFGGSTGRVGYNESAPRGSNAAIDAALTDFFSEIDAYSNAVNDPNRGSNAAIDAALRDYFGEIDAASAYSGLPGAGDIAKVAWNTMKAMMALNPITAAQAAASVKGLMSKDKAAKTQARVSLGRMGYSPSEIEGIESGLTGGGTGSGNGGSAGGGLELGSNIGTPEGGVSMSGVNGGSSNQSLSDQLKSLFEGENAPYNAQDLMQGYTQGAEQAGNEYVQKAQELAKQWEAFVQYFDQKYGDIQGKYDDLDSRYEQNADLSNQVLGQYVNKINSIPELRMQLPGKMGGSSFALAPKNWNNVYSQQAQTANQTIAGQLAALNAQRGSVNEQGDMLGPWANMVATGGQQKGAADLNAFTQKINALKESHLTPFHYGYTMDDRQKQLDARHALGQIGQPNDWDRYAPVVADVITSDAGQDILGDIAEWGKGLFGG